MSLVITQPFINGKVDGSTADNLLHQINPASEEVFTEVQGAGLNCLQRAIDGAQSAFEDHWRSFGTRQRADVLYGIAAVIKTHRDELAQIESMNVGKPIADARDEIELGSRIFEYYAGAISKTYGQTLPVAKQGLDLTLREPLGVVAGIVPWNFPFPIACWKVAPALAAGNSVLLKPASISPLTALALGYLAHEAGLPSGVLQVIPGPGSSIGEAITKHPLVRKVSFTGSTESGARIMELAAPGIKRVSLELGGKSPNIVFADADLERAARESPMSVFANTGQDCCARSRIFVEDSIYDAFVERFLEATQALKVGDPLLDGTQLGPMVSATQRASVESYIQSARQDGRTLAWGGDRPYAKGYYLNPTVILDTETNDRCWKEEIFGPVVCIRRFHDESTMLKEVNDTPYGLSGSIWTQHLARAIRVARQVESGVLSINTHSSVHVEAPFGGYKQSGIGRDLGMNALDGYCEIKNIFIAED